MESNFLQTLHKDLIKQQDVIYGTNTHVHVKPLTRERSRLDGLERSSRGRLAFTVKCNSKVRCGALNSVTIVTTSLY